MDAQKIIDYISKGRTDLIFDLLHLPGWKHKRPWPGMGQRMDWNLFGDYLPDNG